MTLKRELESPRSPIRRFLDERLPHTTGVLDPWQQAVKGIKPRLPGADPDGGPTPNAVLGHAITARIGWAYAPADRPDTRAGGRALVAHGAPGLLVDALVDRLAGAVPQHPYDAARLAWFAGLLARAHRSGRWDDAWYRPFLTAGSIEALLQEVPDPWAADIVAVQRRAERALAPLAAEVAEVAEVADTVPAATGEDRDDRDRDGDEDGDTGHTADAASGRVPKVGVTFAGSAAVDAAEADLVLAGTVVELKVTATTKTRLRDLHQVIALALLDTDDAHAVSHVALAPVRFGVLVRWDLAALVTEMAGAPVDIAQLRMELRDHLRGSADRSAGRT